MPDFNVKMHQNRFRLALRPRPRWGAYSAPRPLAGFKGSISEGRRGEGEEGRGRSTCLPPRFDNPGYGPRCIWNTAQHWALPLRHCLVTLL